LNKTLEFVTLAALPS